MSTAGTGTMGGSAAIAPGSGSAGSGGTAGMAPQGRPTGAPAAAPVTGTPGVRTRRWRALPRRWWLQRGSPVSVALWRVPRWGVASAAAAPLMLVAGGGQLGLAERVMGVTQAGWPLMVALSCRLSRTPHATAYHQPLGSRPVAPSGHARPVLPVPGKPRRGGSHLTEPS